MKNQALFSSKDKSKKLKCRLLQLLFSALRVKGKKLLLWEYFLRHGPCEKRGKNKIEKLHALKAYSVHIHIQVILLKKLLLHLPLRH